MLVLGFLLLFGAGVSGEPKLISNYVVNIENGVLLNVESTPSSTGDLNLSGMELVKIDVNCFKKANGLKSLDLSSNYFYSILPYMVFRFLGDLEDLHLENSRITNLEWIFYGLSKLQSLDLRRNNFSELTPGCFYGLSNTTKIQLSDDAGSSIKEIHFLKPYPLLSLCMNNGIVSSLEVFDENTEAENFEAKCSRSYHPLIDWTVDLTLEQITGVEPGWWNILDENVHILKLIRNNITHLTAELINDLPDNLWEVDLSWNNVTSIKSGIINNRHLRKLNFIGNPIVDIEPFAFDETIITDLALPFAFINSLPRQLDNLTLTGKVGNLKYKCRNTDRIPW